MINTLSLSDYLLIVHISNEEEALNYFEKPSQNSTITKFGSSYQFS